MGRIIAIGDVHGCFGEFETLLERLHIGSEDRVIQLGDLVNRGPNSHRTVQIARQAGVEGIVGNHEIRLLDAYRNKSFKTLSPDDRRTYGQLSEADWQYLGSLPRFRQERTLETVFVHGGFIPGRPWHQQTADVVSTVQMIGPKGELAKRSQAAANYQFWADLWQGPPFVVYGHTPRRHIFPRPGSLGIDTGCVYGGHLTAFILPERSIIQVPAQAVYLTSRHV